MSDNKKEFFKDEKRRSLVFFTTAFVALIILLFIPCPGFYIYLFALLVALVAIVNGANLLFKSGFIDKLLAKQQAEPVIVKKYANADLERFRRLFLNIGFVLSLTIIVFAFNWTQCDQTLASLTGRLAIPDEIEVEPPQTKQEPPPPPPEVIEIEEVPDEEILEDEPEIQETEATEEMELPPDEPEEPEIFVIVEEMPSFPGGEQKLYSFLTNNIKYPKIASNQGIEGNVVLTFVVTETGSITDIKVLRDIGGGCADEAIRVVKLMPKWNVGKQRGKPVKVQFNLPIGFTLR